MKRFTLFSVVSALLLALTVLGTTPSLLGIASPRRAPTMYEVSVTNLTRGQPFSPVVIATHSEMMEPIFMVGQPASDELYPVAEDAMNTDLINKLTADSEVWDVQTLTGVNGPILPGETASVMIESDTGFPLISMVSMLVVTNDAFFGLNGEDLPFMLPVRYTAPAYDAGSEANNENGRFIPGPPFGSGGVRDTSGAEGYVHVHSGVFGHGSLDPAQHDWRNPVAYITIVEM